MPGRQTKFSVAWLQYMDSNEQISEWCQKGKDDYHGYCNFCYTDIKCGNAGKVQLLQHDAKNKHKEAIKHYKDNKKTKLYFPVNQEGTSTSVAQPSSSSAAGPSTSVATSGKTVGCINYGEASLEAEIYWLAKMTSSNYSLRSSDHVVTYSVLCFQIANVKYERLWVYGLSENHLNACNV